MDFKKKFLWYKNFIFLERLYEMLHFLSRACHIKCSFCGEFTRNMYNYFLTRETELKTIPALTEMDKAMKEIFTFKNVSKLADLEK